ncbi:polymorphic toxin-type HINT domain-containing protein [Nonomuraea sp. 3-1Str]|uniref:polymorphic toxin-type HINT domain-containing protein n=1 Tax=Nonomuraea sp. 3-1Str TaxID=2929801 RepID=UPI0037C608B3
MGLARDPETGETKAEPVTAVMTSKGSKHLVQMGLDIDGQHGDSRGTLIATDHHPFWVPALRKWIKATELEPGMWLRTSTGTHVQVSAIKRWDAVQRVHNLTVRELHTYYVLAGDQAVLVHNSGPCGGFKVGVSPDEITDINRGFGGENLLSGSPANTLANASRYNSFWENLRL